METRRFYPVPVKVKTAAQAMEGSDAQRSGWRGMGCNYYEKEEIEVFAGRVG